MMMENKNNNIITPPSNEDLLKVENLQKNEYIVTASVVDVPVIKEEKRPQKITVFKAIASSFTLRDQDEIYSKIRPVKTLKYSIFILIFTALLYFFYQVADVKLVLPLIVIFGAVAFPILYISFCYELCPKKDASFFQIFLSFAFGVLIYVLINALVNSVLVQVVYRSTIDSIIVPILWGVCELIFVAILSKMYNIKSIMCATLFAVAVGEGYAFAWALHELVQSLFISVEVIIGSGVEHYIGSAIVDDLAFTHQSIKAAFEGLAWQAFYFPAIIAFWSTVIGNVAIGVGGAKGERKDTPVSIYLFLVLVIVLYMLSVFTTSFDEFDLALKVISILISLVVALPIINNALNREVGEYTESEKEK